MPCNTLHSLMPKIRRASKLEFLDLIEEVSKEIEHKYQKIGILCTTKTRKDKLYEKYLQGVQIIYPNEEEQRDVSEIISRIIRGKATSNDKKYLEKLIRLLIESGAEKVLLACTDLGNLIENNNTLDTTKILVKAILNKANS